MTRVLVYGLGIAGTSVARALVARGNEVVLADDQLSPQHEQLGRELGAEIFPAGDLGALASLVKNVDSVMPAPGVPETHPLFAISIDAQKEMLSEIELAYRWEQSRSGGPRPILAVTGTDGKTTTTLMAAAMIRASGVRVATVGIQRRHSLMPSTAMQRRSLLSAPVFGYRSLVHFAQMRQLGSILRPTTSTGTTTLLPMWLPKQKFGRT